MKTPSKLPLVCAVLVLFISCSDNESLKFPTEAEVELMYASSSSTKNSSSSSEKSSSSVSSSSAQSSSSAGGSFTQSSSSIIDPIPMCGTTPYNSEKYFCDTRDYKVYRFVTIGNQVWMAENLNYDVPSNDTDLCYNDRYDNCNIYGRFYDWTTAMAIFSPCSNKLFAVSDCGATVSANHQGICPNGWHLPSHSEWTALMNFADFENDNCAGTYLKSNNLWNSSENIPEGLGNDGFAAFPSGYGYTSGDSYSFNNIGNSVIWWSISEESEEKSWAPTIFYTSEDVNFTVTPKEYLLSVRCIRN